MIHYVFKPVFVADPLTPNFTTRDLNLIEADVNAFTQDNRLTIQKVTPFCEWDGTRMWVGAMIEYIMRPR